MPTFNKVEGQDNLFIDEDGRYYSVTDGSMEQVNITMEQRLSIMDAKVKSGAIQCNLDNLEDCEACGS